jgi:hypothetical protein
VPILRHLLRDRDGLDESRVGGLPVGLSAHLFLDQAAEVEAAHDLFHDVEAVIAGGIVDRRGIFRQFGSDGGEFLGSLPFQGLPVFRSFDAAGHV